MIPWSWLGEAERWAVVEHVKSFSPRFREEGAGDPVAVPPPPPEPDYGATASGLAVAALLLAAFAWTGFSQLTQAAAQRDQIATRLTEVQRAFALISQWRAVTWICTRLSPARPGDGRARCEWSSGHAPAEPGGQELQPSEV